MSRWFLSHRRAADILFLDVRSVILKLVTKILAFARAVLCLCSCRGSVPDRDSPPGAEISAVLIGGRMLVSSAESRNGATAINLEGDEGRYRLPVYAADTALYRVDPGVYRLSPPRSVVGLV